jgi:glutaredoxin
MRLKFYYRENCDLCDAMRKALIVFNRNRQSIDWQEIDIDRDINLISQFDTQVPVLCIEEQKICHHFFDERALLAVLN